MSKIAWDNGFFTEILGEVDDETLGKLRDQWKDSSVYETDRGIVISDCPGGPFGFLDLEDDGEYRFNQESYNLYTWKKVRYTFLIKIKL